MATVHHPPTTSAGFGHNHEWLWLILGPILIALAASAITWAVTSPDTVSETEIASTIDGFDLDDDTTAAKIATPGVTLSFVGRNGDGLTGPRTTMGFELDDDTTAIKIASPGVTTTYFGHNPDLNPDR